MWRIVHASLTNYSNVALLFEAHSHGSRSSSHLYFNKTLDLSKQNYDTIDLIRKIGKRYGLLSQPY